MRHVDTGNCACAVAQGSTFFFGNGSMFRNVEVSLLCFINKHFLVLVQAGQFIIEYCGEVISWKEARRRSQAYEAEGK